MHRTSFLGALAVGLVGAHAALAQTSGTIMTPSPNDPTTRVGTRGANFLLLPVGARGEAMAGAYTGLATGVTAMYWNPAGVASTDVVSAGFTSTALYKDLDIKHTFMGVLIPALGGALGINYNRLDSGDIPRTDEANPDGGNPQFGSVFSWGSTAVGLTFGRRLTDRLAVGVGAKTITEGMDGASASWWAVDVGTTFNTGLYGLSLGAALTNIGSQARYSGPVLEQRVTADQAFQVDVPLTFTQSRIALPTAFRFSVTSHLTGAPDALLSTGGPHVVRAVLEFYDGTDTDLMTTLAGEYGYRDLIFLRAGKRFFNEARSDFRSSSFGFSWGGGIRLPVFRRHLSFDYAYTMMGELDNVQTFSFEFGN